MTTLKQTQQSFFDAVLGVDEPENERLQIYRHTILDNYRHALEITFPGVWVLLGSECADNVAYAFCQDRARLPQTGCLDDWGAEFPEFLASIQPLQTLPYLKDFAEFEWRKHHALLSTPQPSVNLTTLAQLAPKQQLECRFEFLPYVHFYRSNFPIDQIEEIAENPEAEGITLTNQASFAIVTQSLTLWMTQSLWVFLSLLRDGHTLESAAETQTAADPEFDLTSAIQLLFEYPLISSIITK